MAEPNNVFISWSGPRSKAAAEAFVKWLPQMIQRSKPWMSEDDIQKGSRGLEEMAAALNSLRVGIICLTPENLTEPWILYEAGALSKTQEAKSRVCTYLFAHLKKGDLKNPLAMFQATEMDKEDTRKLLHTINKNLDGPVLSDATLNIAFDKFWPDLEKELQAVNAMPGASPSKPDPGDAAAETLGILRTIAPIIIGIGEETEETKRRRLAEAVYINSLASNPYNVFTSVSPVISGAHIGPTGYQPFSTILEGNAQNVAALAASRATPAELTAAAIRQASEQVTSPLETIAAAARQAAEQTTSPLESIAAAARGVSEANTATSEDTREPPKPKRA